MLKRLLIAALMMLGLAALAPQGASAAPVGPSAALLAEAAPGSVVEKAQFYGYGYRRRWGPRPFYRRPYYGYRPYYRRPFYRRPYYGYRPYYRRRFYY